MSEDRRLRPRAARRRRPAQLLPQPRRPPAQRQAAHGAAGPARRPANRTLGRRRARRAGRPLVQRRFLESEVPPGDLAAIEAAIAREMPGVEKVKVRSSSNAEDIPNFDGAGLHDSFSAKPAKHSKKPKCQFDLDDDERRRRRWRSGRRQAQGEAAHRSPARSRASTPACGTSGPSRSGRSPASTSRRRRWASPSSLPTTRIRRSLPTPSSSPASSTRRACSATPSPCSSATTW